MNRQSSIHRNIYTGVFLVSLSILMLELTLTRIFSVTLWYHFAFMVISLALFGMGASGILLFLLPSFFTREKLQKHLIFFSSMIPVSTLISTIIVIHIPNVPDISWQGFFTLSLIYIFSSVPFFFGGLTISLVITHYTSFTSRIYFFDLLGAGLGCILILPVLKILGGASSILFIATVSSLVPLTFSLVLSHDNKNSRTEIATRKIDPFISLKFLFCAAVCIVFIGLSYIGSPIHLSEKSSFFDVLAKIYGVKFFKIRLFLYIFSALYVVLAFFSHFSKGKFYYLNRIFHSAHASPFLLFLTLLTALIVNFVSPVLDVYFSKGKVRFNLVYSGWNPYSMVVVTRGNLDVQNPYKKIFAWGLSPRYHGAAPDQLGVYIDGCAGTPITKFSGDFSAVDYVKYDITSFGFYLTNAARSLVIGPGGGKDVLAALAFGCSKVIGVELNPIIVDLVKRRFADFAGNLYSREDVDVVVDEGRSFIRGSREKYDVILCSMIDTFAASSAGAFALSENNLYTVEAFKDYINHLTDDGILTMSRWIFIPPKQALRVVTIGIKALEQLGVAEPWKHIMVVANKQNQILENFEAGSDESVSATEAPVSTFLLKKSPFTEHEIQKAEMLCDSLGFNPVYMPGSAGDSPFHKLLHARDTDEFVKEYPYDVSASTDNRPFFFHMLKTRDLFNFLNDKQEQWFNDVAVFILMSLFFIVVVLALMFFIIPLLIKDPALFSSVNKQRAGVLLYFACLGLGFMFIEITLIHKFVLFLGHPIYALSIILFSILMSGGVGSFYSHRFAEEQYLHKLIKIIPIICALSIIYLLFLSSVFSSLIQAPLILKALITIVLICPAGFLMGMPFPTGLKLSKNIFPDIVPWAWGINGALSVVGSVAALIMAMNTGYNLALLAGALIYLLGLIFLIYSTHKKIT